MDCRHFHKNLEDYLEGGLDFSGRFGMERHAQQCFACGKVVADAQKLNQMTRELKRVGAPADFEAAVMNRIRRKGLKRPGWKFWHMPAFFLEWPSWRAVSIGASAIVLVGFVIFMSARSMRTDRVGIASTTEQAPVAAPERESGGVSTTATLHPTEVADLSAPAGVMPQIKVPARRSRVVYSTEDEGSAVNTESADTDYVEYLVPGPGDRQYVMRLPKTIRMRYGQPSEEYFIRNVSH